MIPILFDAKATDFTTNGIGRLSDTISAVVTEERNGIYELDLEYPVTGVHYSDINHSKIIAVKASQTSGIQAFRVYKISREINGRVRVSCRHISYQLAYIPFKAFSANSLAGALAAFKSSALEPCPFTLTADFTSTSSFAVPLPASIRSYLGGRQGSIIDVYGNGAEWEWNNYTCILHANRGADRGVVLRYGKNITDLSQETNIENTITGIMPYWKSDTAIVTLAAPVESDTAANFPFPRTIVKDFSDQWENAPTQAQLTAYTQSYIRANKIGIPAISIDVSFVNLADTIEYKEIALLESVSLCDTITVEFVKLGISAKAKVVKTEYDVLKERYKAIEVGDARGTLSSTIEEQMTAINQRPTIDQTQVSIDRATGVLNSGLRGHVIINRNSEGWANEILFLDNENVAQAKNVLRINTNGIGFSSTGYNGPFYQSWTIDGHFALGGVNNAYGDFEILDSSGKALGEWNKDGLRFFDDSGQRVLLAVNHGGMFLYNAAGNKLAQLTPAGLNVYEGSIEGGTIKIGNNFNVDRQGNLTANNAKFNGGTIQIGNKFNVRNDGTMTASGANFSGNITAGTIKIGQKFEVKSDGTMSAVNANFTGKITGSEITGSSFKTGDQARTFEANGDHVKLGPFYAYQTERGGKLFFATDDEKIGFGDNDGWILWEGWNGEYPDDADDPNDVFQNFDFGIHNENVFCYDVYCSNSAFWGQSESRYWSLGECMDDIYAKLSALTAASNALDARVTRLEGIIGGGGS